MLSLQPVGELLSLTLGVLTLLMELLVHGPDELHRICGHALIRRESIKRFLQLLREEGRSFARHAVKQNIANVLHAIACEGDGRSFPGVRIHVIP